MTPTEWKEAQLAQPEKDIPKIGCVNHDCNKCKAQPEQEPVALKMDVIVVNLVREGINKHRARELAEHFIKHTTSPQRKPLPYEKVVDLWLARFDTNEYDEVFMNFARAIEAAHGIKGEA